MDRISGLYGFLTWLDNHVTDLASICTHISGIRPDIQYNLPPSTKVGYPVAVCLAN